MVWADTQPANKIISVISLSWPQHFHCIKRTKRLGGKATNLSSECSRLNLAQAMQVYSGIQFPFSGYTEGKKMEELHTVKPAVNGIWA